MSIDRIAKRGAKLTAPPMEIFLKGANIGSVMLYIKLTIGLSLLGLIQLNITFIRINVLISRNKILPAEINVWYI